MLNAAQLSQLIDPVIFRAQANCNASSSGFIDQAACSVLRQLGFECEKTLSQNTWKRRTAILKRWQWIDKQTSSFFERHPDGIGLEANGGLSTRFHRLSQSIDWPQFSWQIINTYDVSQLVSRVFPALDNHVSTTCDDPVHDWCERVNWSEETPKIVICNENQVLQSWTDFQQLSSSIFSHLTQQTATVDVLVSHHINNLEEKIAQSEYPISIMSSYSNSTAKKNAGQQLFAKMSSQFTSMKNIHTSHLVFYR